MKIVSLRRALRSGNKFKWKMPGESSFKSIYTPGDQSKKDWTTNEILYADCKIIEEPREIWLSEHNEKLFGPFPTKEACLSYDGDHRGRPVKFREVIEIEVENE